jgi:hypothetical protein
MKKIILIAIAILTLFQFSCKEKPVEQKYKYNYQTVEGDELNTFISCFPQPKKNKYLKISTL